MTPSLGIEPEPQWWESSALTTARSLRASVSSTPLYAEGTDTKTLIVVHRM